MNMLVIDKDNCMIIHYFGHFKCWIDVVQQRWSSFHGSFQEDPTFNGPTFSNMKRFAYFLEFHF